MIAVWMLACGDVAVGNTRIVNTTDFASPCTEPATLLRPWRYWHNYQERSCDNGEEQSWYWADGEGNCYHSLTCGIEASRDPFVLDCEQAALGERCCDGSFSTSCEDL